MPEALTIANDGVAQIAWRYEKKSRVAPWLCGLSQERGAKRSARLDAPLLSYTLMLRAIASATA
jgi:hypothetical protein